MTTMEDQMLFENLDEKFEDETSVVTAKWFSLNFDQTIDESERLLAAYLAERKGLSAVYLLTGLDANDQVLVQLVPEEKLKHAEKRFTKPPVKVVYGLQRQACRSSSALASMDLLLDLTQEKLKKLTTIPWDPTAAVAPQLPLSHSQKNQLNSSETLKPSSAPSATVTTATLPKIVSAGRDPHIKTTQVKNFFAPVDKPTTNQTTAAPKPSLKRASLFFEVQKENTPVKHRSNEESDDEADFLTSSVTSSSKRKRLIVESDEEMEDPPRHTTTAAPINKVVTSKGSVKAPIPDTKIPSDITPVKSGRKKKNAKEVLVEDSETDSPQASKPPSRGRKSRAEKQSEQPAAKPKTPEKRKSVSQPEPQPSAVKSSPVKKTTAQPSLHSAKPNRVRRQVMKTFKDEDGFMVTEKVWVSGSEAEEEEEDDDDHEKEQTSKSTSVNAKPSTEKSVPQSSTMLGNARLTGAPTLGTLKPTHQPASKTTSIKAPARKPASKQASLSAFFGRA